MQQGFSSSQTLGWLRSYYVLHTMLGDFGVPGPILGETYHVPGSTPRQHLLRASLRWPKAYYVWIWFG